MNAREFLDLQDAYQGVYQELDEVSGGGRIDPVADMPGIGERGARSPRDAGLKMSPIDRAEARANALKKRNDPEATKRANRINSRFVKPTERAVNRSLLAATNARSAEKKRLMNPQESYEYDTFDAILEHLVAEGYADTNENAIAIMANMSEEWKEEILDEAYQEPRFGKKDYIRKLSKRGGMGMGTSEDPHGYRDPKMAKVGAEFSKRKTAAAKAKKTGEPDSYRAEKEAQSKRR